MEPTELEGVSLITPVVRRDSRGVFVETFNRNNWFAAGFKDEWVQDNTSISTMPFTLRGLHFQIPPGSAAKLVRVVRGSIFDVVVDIREDSPTYGHHISFELTADFTHLYVPVGFAHGFCTLEPETEVAYKVTNTWSAELDKGLAWNDPDLAIRWPTDDPILSEKDKSQPHLSDLPAYFIVGRS